MDFMALPPELTSALIHAGPGAASLIEASTAWQQVAVELENSVSSYSSVLCSLAETWDGPSAAAMADAVAPYITWLRTTAQQSHQMAASAQAAATAFNSTVSAMVHPSEVAANRTRLAKLVATNAFGRNLPAIAATEDQYLAMWANNSAAMKRYQAAAAQALDLKQFLSPPAVVDPGGAAAQASAAGAAAATPAQSTIGDLLTNLVSTPFGFDPNKGWFGLANTYANQFISSGFPINLLSYVAQATSAQALQTVGADVGQGLSEGMSALGGIGSSLSSATEAAGSGPTAAIGVGLSVGKLTAPPAVVGLLPASQTPVQLTSAASPLDAADAGFPMLPPLMPPPISAGSGWRKRKQPKPEDLEYGTQVKGKVIRTPPSAG
ncbi:PPE family protein [Mycobacterium sp.]|uniref:PPE family protein n=1 Tax=Mycobacterium sp. TaxID=1785 RepID=UPI0025E18D0E|nr:PPE family protein [Mycobacterium sp.]MBW0012328.1 PPE family protein [Mycobacterium sp.]